MFYDDVLKDIKGRRPGNSIPKDLKLPAADMVRFAMERGSKIFKDILEDANIIVVKDAVRYMDVMLDVISLEDFKNFKMPFDNIFIEMDVSNELPDDVKTVRMGIHIFHDSNLKLRSSDYTFVVYMDDSRTPNEEIPMVSAEIKLERLPRFYVVCAKDDCDKAVKPQIFPPDVNDLLCMRNTRTSQYCTPGKIIYDALRIAFYSIALMSDPMIQVIHEDKPWKRRRSDGKRKEGSQKYIYINPVKRIYKKPDDSEHVKTERGSPCEHERRGHPRHYKSGKTIWIEPIHVKGNGKPKKSKNIYKVTL